MFHCFIVKWQVKTFKFLKSISLSVSPSSVCIPFCLKNRKQVPCLFILNIAAEWKRYRIIKNRKLKTSHSSWCVACFSLIFSELTNSSFRTHSYRNIYGCIAPVNTSNKQYDWVNKCKLNSLTVRKYNASLHLAPGKQTLLCSFTSLTQAWEYYNGLWPQPQSCHGNCVWTLCFPE